MPTQLSNQSTEPIEELQDIGRRFYARGWSVGTSSNYSVVIGQTPLKLLITASGKDKGQLSPSDFVRVGPQGETLLSQQANQRAKSSAETMLHVVLAEHLEVGGCVLHTHSVWGTVLSDILFHSGRVEISGYEMLKGLAGITTHDSSVGIKIFDNTQDIASLAEEVRELRSAMDPDLDYAFLLRGHGMYTWGATVDEARRHVEVLEFLFEVLGQRRSLAENDDS